MYRAELKSCSLRLRMSYGNVAYVTLERAKKFQLFR